MVTHVYNRFGDIKAYAEWERVNKKGVREKDGEYVYINELFICFKYRKKLYSLFKELIPRVHMKCNGIKYVYWSRRKDEKIRVYDIKKLLRYGRS